MIAVDPRIDPGLVPPGSIPVIVAKNQTDRYIPLPSVITPRGVVITRWELTDEERTALIAGADVFLTIWGVPIRPVHLNIGPCDWRAVDERMVR